MRKIYLYMMLCSFLFIISSCNKNQERDFNTLSVTIAPLKYFTEQIAGNHFEIKSLLPPNTSPENFQPQPEQLLLVSNSEALLGIGSLGFEKVWLTNLAASLPDVKILTTQNTVPKIENNGRIDMHLWMSPKNAKIIANNICNELIVIDSSNANFYHQRLKLFHQKVDSLDSYIRQQTDQLKNRAFAIYHPALSYFAKDYNLKQISIEQNGKEPTPQELKELIKTLKREQVKVLFIEEEFPKEKVQTIEEATGLEAIVINPLNAEWDKEIISITNALCND